MAKKKEEKIQAWLKRYKAFHILLGFLLCICLLGVGFFIFLKTHDDISGNFADTVLRPLIGNQATIHLESAFFFFDDVEKKVQYHFVKPDTHVFSDTKKSAIPDDTAFTLTPIPTDKTALPGEGIWTTILSSSKSALLAQTFLRPDPERDYAIVALMKINTEQLAVRASAGTWEPGEAAHRGSGMVPLRIQQSNALVAAFNGGFQKKDGAYGMIVGNQTYLPLQNGLATLVLYGNKDPQLVRFDGQNFGDDVVAIRQNGPMLLEDGAVVADSAAWNMQTWGLTTTNSMYTWRSGIGITKSGDLVYAVGPSLVPETLALALQKAGAINAMQLDINSTWVRFALYTPLGNGKYASQMLLKEMSNGGLAYLTGYQKDFFYVYKKPEKKILPLTIFGPPERPTTFAGLMK